MSTTLPPARSGGIYEAAFPKPQEPGAVDVVDEPKDPEEYRYTGVWPGTRFDRRRWPTDPHLARAEVEPWDLPPGFARTTITVSVVYDPAVLFPDYVAQRVMLAVDEGEWTPKGPLWRAERTHAWGSDVAWVRP